MFIALISALTTTHFGESLASNSGGRRKGLYLTNWPCQARPTLVDINSKESLFCPFTVIVNKYGRRCLGLGSNWSKKYECKSISFNVSGKWNEIFRLTWIVRV